VTLGTIGWLCPKCNTVYGPSQTTCVACSGVKLTFGTVSTMGTPLDDWDHKWTGLGTIFIGPPASVSSTPPQRDWKEGRAEQIVKDWNGGKWGDLRRLIEEALEEAEDADH